jgi:hypothetical protein
VTFQQLSTGTLRGSDPDTSHETASTLNVARLQAIYMKWVRQLDGATNEEIHQWTGIPLNAISPRSAQLVKKGLLYDSGERRRVASDRNQIVWKARDEN